MATADDALAESDHARALALLDQGNLAEARAVLRDAVNRVLDPEVLNDLAVLAMRDGDAEEAGELLRALVRLHPDDETALANLAALADRAPAEGPHPPVRQESRRDTHSIDAERRSRFLQIVAEACPRHLPDNIDYLFDPWGRELPDPASTGERIAEQLELVEGCTTFWDALGDEASRELTLRFFAYRALGPEHVRLQLQPTEYRHAVIGLSAQMMQDARVVGQGLPLEWQLHHYDFNSLGLPIQVIGPPLPLASTMIFSQYAYRDTGVAARPRPGDIAIDAGGCWGDTALWLAHVIGERGHVHTFEPTPSNLKLLGHNVQLNPSLASRITVWPDALGSEPDATVWIPDIVAAGATLVTEQPDAQSTRMVELQLKSIDQLVAERRIPRVDFIKVDVEGADLGVLEGAAETIRTSRPRLAIACYHKPDDLIRIPDFIADLGVPYTWYLQCSTMTDIDTVAFAVPA